MGLRRLAAVSLASCTLVLCGCGGGSPSDDAFAPDPAGLDQLLTGPPGCAEPGRDGTADQRLNSWSQATSALTQDPGTIVWLGFNRVLSIAEIEALPGGLVVSGIQLVFEQQQGTYVKAQQRFDPVPLDDPTVREQATSILGSATAPPSVSLPGVAPNVFDPADPAVLRGDVPIAGLRVSGDIAAVIAAEGCLIYSLAPGDSPLGPEVSTAIEPPP